MLVVPGKVGVPVPGRVHDTREHGGHDVKHSPPCDECGCDLSARNSVQVGVYFYPEGLDLSAGPSAWQYSTLCDACYRTAADANPAVFGIRKHHRPLGSPDAPAAAAAGAEG